MKFKHVKPLNLNNFAKRNWMQKPGGWPKIDMFELGRTKMAMKMKFFEQVWCRKDQRQLVQFCFTGNESD
jgi:hypothetical protein